MRTTSLATLACAAALLGAVRPAAAQLPDSVAVPDSIETDSVRADSTHIDSTAVDSIEVRAPLPPRIVEYLTTLTSNAPDTPYGMGLIPTGMVEAQIAEGYVWIAGQDSADIRNMTDNMVHVMHAIDPTSVDAGLGLGYGLRQAAEGVRTYIGLATSTEGASPTLLYHAPYIEGAATGAIARADEAMALARRIEASIDPEPTLRLLERLGDLVRAMAYGFDRDRDGRIGNDASEAGLAQAAYHLELVRRVEELDPPPPPPPGLPIPERGRAEGSSGR
jgi:hypothetical protein